MIKFVAKSVFNQNINEAPIVAKSDEAIIKHYDANNVPNNMVFNFANDNIGHLYKELMSSINKRAPFFLWSKDRENNKIRLDNEKQLLIVEKINNLRLLSGEFCNLQADAIFSEQYINFLVADKFAEAEREAELKAAQHKANIAKPLSDADLEYQRVYLAKEQIRSIKVANDKLEAETERIKVQTNMIGCVFEKFDPSSLDQKTLGNIVLNSILPNASLGDFDFQDKMKNNLFDSEKAKTDMLKHQAEEKKLNNDELKAKYERNERNRKNL